MIAKKSTALILTAILSISLLTACGSRTISSSKESETKDISDIVEPIPENDNKAGSSETGNSLDDLGDKLDAVGDIETEKGIFSVKTTVPAEFMEGATQEQLDEGAGDYYKSAELNADGSVTYTLSKSQQKKILDELKNNVDESIQEIIDDNENYSIDRVTYNKDLTQFDVTLSGSEPGFGDSFAVLGFYMMTGTYHCFSGEQVDNVVVNFYDPSGNLITTANSKDLE